MTSPEHYRAFPERALVIGYGLSGRSAADWLAGGGCDVVVLEDDLVAGQAAQAAAEVAGLTVEIAPGPTVSADLAQRVDLVVPSPGVRAGHPAIAGAIAAGVPVLSELELAWRVLDGAHEWRGGERPKLVAITGTNGKTTVTQLVTAMLACSGRAAVASGNVGYPLLEAVRHLTPGSGPVLVAEVSSFQLEYTDEFRPDVSCWLNFAPDHLDWHPTLEHYWRAKAKIWSRQGPGCTAVINADDPVVQQAAESVPGGVDVVTFGFSRSLGAASPPLLAGDDSGPNWAGPNWAGPNGDGPNGDGPAWVIRHEGIKGPRGFFLASEDLPRALPHDLANTAAALAISLASGASEDGCLEAARKTVAPPHRVQLVAEKGGIAWYDDSKATTPAAVLAGVRGFSSVVLIAGGRNKGLDLSELASTVPPVRAVVAVGESAPDVARAFAGRAPVRRAASMGEAVDAAAGLAVPGDVVVLSPGCASFDWYSSYVERGEDFSALVQGKLRSEPDGASHREAGIP